MRTVPAVTETAARPWLAFAMAGHEYAVDLSRVREIVRCEGLTRVPRVAPCIRGVVNLRGRVVPAVDLAAALGLPASPVGPETCLLITEVVLGGEASTIGVVADAVNQLLDLSPEDVEPPPSFGTRVPAAFLLGVARSGNRFVPLLDLDRVLSEGVLGEARPQESA